MIFEKLIKKSTQSGMRELSEAKFSQRAISFRCGTLEYHDFYIKKSDVFLFVCGKVYKIDILLSQNNQIGLIYAITDNYPCVSTLLYSQEGIGIIGQVLCIGNNSKETEKAIAYANDNSLNLGFSYRLANTGKLF